MAQRVARKTKARPLGWRPPTNCIDMTARRYTSTYVFLGCLIGLFLVGGVETGHAQYFGRNKVQYDQFDFRSFKTEHFEIFYYPESEVAVQDAGRMAERWYARHTNTFVREFRVAKPLIFYANDADFQQTNAISGSIGQGTGGVTESLKERVVMPLTGLYADTDHVLGHELVHSFQYDIGLIEGDSMRFNLGLLPLWLIEGTAEYLSVGRVDAHTAMWMRDAAVRDDLPTIEDLTRGTKYFPYRYGQSYMAYIGGKYGDATVANIFKTGGRTGLDSAIVYTLGISADSLSTEWAEAIKAAYLPDATGRTPADSVGSLIIGADNGGDMNIAPSVSPDGTQIAYLSERDLFDINLFFADTETGALVRRMRGNQGDAHFDAIRYINSSGTYSPDGTQFAFVTFVRGDNELAILDTKTGRITRRIAIDGVNAMSNPAWSPDGVSIAFSGIHGGISDLYLLNLETREVQQLTDDRYGDLQPAWSPDGTKLAFVSDRGPEGTNFAELTYGKERIAILDLASNTIETPRPLGNVRYFNPQFGTDNATLYFLSDYEGYRDLYRMDVEQETVFRLTQLQTGVSGITQLSPALSVARQTGDVYFSVFSNNEYTIHRLRGEELVGTPVNDPEVGPYALAAVLPPASGANRGLVSTYLAQAHVGLPEATAGESSLYGPKLELDYVAPPSVGASFGGPFGGGVAGGVAFFFSDMLGGHNLYVAAQANGTVKDIGGQASYINRSNRFNYGASVGHIPLLLGGTSVGYQDGYQIIQQFRQRIFIDELSFVGAYPFSSTRRIEADLGFVRYGFDYEVEEYVFNPYGAFQRQRRSLPSPDPFYFFQSGLAYVTDYSFFGFTSPVRGGRSRFDVSPYIGSDTYVRILADYRRYFFLRPFTLAIRGVHVGNYGASEAGDSNLFSRMYLGYANSANFVRGYSFYTYGANECLGGFAQNDCAGIDDLLGTRMALGSIEARIPLFGTDDYGLIPFQYLPTEITFFADAGVAWTAAEESINLRPSAFEFRVDRPAVTSAGISGRFNLFGYLIMEVYYAHPFQRPERGAHVGVQLVPGW